jgi:hypothetical protein
VADAATSTLSLVGRAQPIVQGPKNGEIAGVAFSADGTRYAYNTSTYGSNGSIVSTSLVVRRPGYRRVYDLDALEKRTNPDGRITYGVDKPSKCVRDAFAKGKDLPPVRYRGIIESHPYAVASVGNSWVVADAAGNDLLKVDHKGRLSALTALPRQPLRLTAAAAKSFGLPKCAIGVTYNFESVPTDVELGPNGMLYVSTLPGGPEGPVPGFENRGKVYKVNPRNRRITLAASGFSGATNVAVAPDGTMYVAEFGAGRIAVVKGRKRTTIALPNVVAVEYHGGRLYATTVAPTDDKGNPTGKGKLVRIG